MQYECLRMHLNHNLPCPKCLEAYFAVETKLTSATAQKKATASAGMFKFNNNNTSNNSKSEWTPCLSSTITTRPASAVQVADLVQQVLYRNKLSHTAGIDALVKQKHPHWSPAAIKSALMTTSTTLDRAERPFQAQQYSESGTMSLVRTMPFDFGSGHVNPRAALDPRLIFDPALARGCQRCRRLSLEMEVVVVGVGEGCRRRWKTRGKKIWLTRTAKFGSGNSEDSNVTCVSLAKICCWLYDHQLMGVGGKEVCISVSSCL
ncbi:putative Subtilisin-like serine protease 3 [Abeliophyllum distichum]|uniref:Subtilisin-like serine protease 3 n=1 Tax=Abeliophyllum distichum TaxID=126358 RepID=A0ABD1QKT9_9LAMI